MLEGGRLGVAGMKAPSFLHPAKHHGNTATPSARWRQYDVNWAAGP